MTRKRRLSFALPALLTLALLPPATAAPSADTAVPATCPVTLPSEPAFIPPGPYPQAPPSAPRSFWHGTSGLWTMLDTTGIYHGLALPSPTQPGGIITRNKVFWWTPGFHPMWNPATQRHFKVDARRLDGEAPKFARPWVTNAHVPEWGGWSLLTMVELPTVGCWEVTGTLGGDSVSFVVWVAPPRA